MQVSASQLLLRIAAVTTANTKPAAGTFQTLNCLAENVDFTLEVNSIQAERFCTGRSTLPQVRGATVSLTPVDPDRSDLGYMIFHTSVWGTGTGTPTVVPVTPTTVYLEFYPEGNVTGKPVYEGFFKATGFGISGTAGDLLESPIEFESQALPLYSIVP